MLIENSQLTQSYLGILNDIKICADEYNRQNSSISLIAVSKRHSANNILQLLQLGQQEFAENYLQEGLLKIEEIKQSCTTFGVENNAVWHFIGHIQSRKCKNIANSFQWVHTVDSVKVAQKLDQHRQGHTPLNVLIQVNLQQEETKSGINASELPNLAKSISLLHNLKLRGLMIIPKSQTDFEQQRSIFRQCRQLFEQLNKQGFELDHLSMGMTQDMKAAIAEGATQLRIGTAIFGPRQN